MSLKKRQEVTDLTGGIPQAFPQSNATGAFTPEHVERDAYGEYDENAIDCAQCGANIVDYTKLEGGVCWLCGGDNFLGNAWPDSA